jgi:hypothetical protein
VYDVFLSYHARDSSYAAAAIEELLGRQLQPESIFRGWDIGPGIDWRSTVERALHQAAVVVVIIGPNWQELVSRHRDSGSSWVEREITEALSARIAVLPVLLDDAHFDPLQLPPQLHTLADRQYAHVRKQSFSEDVSDLAEALWRLAPDRLPQPTPPPEPVRTAEETALAVPSYSDSDIRRRGIDPRQSLIGLADESGRVRYPAFQFDPTGRPIEVVVRINSLLGADDDPWGVVDWWLAPNIWLGAAPVDLLDEPDEETLVAAAKAVSSRE